MGVKKLKPTSPGRRFQTVSDFESVTKATPEKSLLDKKKSSSGRNSYGRITSRHRGGGHKRRYRVVDFRRNKDGVPATVAGIEYDPNRNSRIALLHYHDGEKRYIIAPLGLEVGDVLDSGSRAEIRVGNALPLRNIPTGTTVHAVEMRPGGGAKMGRAAGTAIQLMSKEGGYALLRLPSGEMRQVELDCRATVGQVGNPDAELVKIGKAGRNRWKGKRPQSRGVVMNPVDHPLGGGVIRLALGASRRVVPARRTRQATNTSCVAEPRRVVANGTQSEKGALCRRPPDEQGRSGKFQGRKESNPDLESSFHNHSRDGRTHNCGPRRPQTCPGIHQ